MLSNPIAASQITQRPPTDHPDLYSVAEGAASRYLAWSLRDSGQNPQNLERSATSDIDIMVVDEFTKSGQDYATGSKTSHGEETSWLADQFSTDSSVQVDRITFAGFTGFADWMNELAASGDAPKVMNLSLGMDPGSIFYSRMGPLQASFSEKYGSNSDDWSAAAVEEFKSSLQDLAEACQNDFSESYGDTPKEVKEGLTNLVNAGTTVTIAAGNAGEVKALFDKYDLTLPSDFFDGTYPSDLPPGVIVVGASTGDTASDTAADFTAPMNGVDVAADGTDVTINTYGEEGNGTSYSAPEIAGLVGDMLALDPTLTPAEIEATLKAAAAPVSGKEAYVGAGIVDRSEALDLVESGEAHKLLTDSDNTDSGTTDSATDAPPVDSATTIANALKAAGMTDADVEAYASTVEAFEVDPANKRPGWPEGGPSFLEILEKKLAEGVPARDAILWARFSGLVSDDDLGDSTFMTGLAIACDEDYETPQEEIAFADSYRFNEWYF